MRQKNQITERKISFRERVRGLCVWLKNGCRNQLENRRFSGCSADARYIPSPGIGGAGKKARAFFDFCFFSQMFNTLSRSKGLQGRLVDSGFPAESRLQKIPIQTIQDFFAMEQESQ
jgi:hypothetical protein